MKHLPDLEAAIRSRPPLLVIRSSEESRVMDALKRHLLFNDRSLWVWTVTHGLRPYPHGETLYATGELPDALRYIEKSAGGGVYVFIDAHPYLEDPLVVRQLKNLALTCESLDRTLVLLSHQVNLPAELEAFATYYTPSLPTPARLMEIVNAEATAWRIKNGTRVRSSHNALNLLIQHLGGLTEDHAQRLARMVIRDDGEITLSDIGKVLKAKHEALQGSEILALEENTVDPDSLAGLTRFKHWLNVRRTAFLEPEEGLPPPKGVLLLGVQGAGKSLASKTVAALWQLPLFRLDFGSLYRKYHGETEENLRRVLHLANAMAPCVLWIDEIEKGIANDGSGSSDGGVSQRILGTLLTWMAERQARVFMVATANDISRLPPELLRKGRFDEIFFVDLPDHAAREQIFRFHLEKISSRAPDSHHTGAFDYSMLADLAEGFSGAEIEQAVISAAYEARSTRQPINTPLVEAELRRTRPLSVIMAEKVEALRAWARERAVPA